VLRALQEKLLQQDLFEEFCDEFMREMNRLRMKRSASLSSAKREVERIGTRIKKLLNLMLDDEIAVDARAMPRSRRSTLAARNCRLSSRTRRAASAAAPRDGRPVPPEGDDARASPRALRHAHGGDRGAPWAHRRHHPDAGARHAQNRIERNLAAMLSAAVHAKRSPETGDFTLQVVMVAGAGFEPATFGL
jgi:site-specific DNA recombinase